MTEASNRRSSRRTFAVPFARHQPSAIVTWARPEEETSARERSWPATAANACLRCVFEPFSGERDQDSRARREKDVVIERASSSHYGGRDQRRVRLRQKRVATLKLVERVPRRRPFPIAHVDDDSAGQLRQSVPRSYSRTTASTVHRQVAHADAATVWPAGVPSAGVGNRESTVDESDKPHPSRPISQRFAVTHPR